MLKRILTNLCLVMAFFAVIFGMGYTLVSCEQAPSVHRPHKHHHEKFVCPNCGFELPLPPHKGPEGDGHHGHHGGMRPQAPGQPQMPAQPQCPAGTPNCDEQSQPAPQCNEGLPMPPAPQAPGEHPKQKPAPRN